MTCDSLFLESLKSIHVNMIPEFGIHTYMHFIPKKYPVLGLRNYDVLGKRGRIHRMTLNIKNPKLTNSSKVDHFLRYFYARGYTFKYCNFATIYLTTLTRSFSKMQVTFSRRKILLRQVSLNNGILNP